MLSARSIAQLRQPPSNSNAFGAIGIAAYEQGDFQRAKYWLEAAVYDASIIDAGGQPDPWAALYLARMHYFGDGVARDESLACALFETAVRNNQAMYGDSNSRAKFKRILGGDPCPLAGAFSSEEVKALWNGCFWPGLVPAQFPIANGLMTIDHGRVQAQVGEHHWESSFPGFNGCQTIFITPFGHVQLSNRDGTSVRDFVYLFGIEGSREGVQIVRTLRWYLLEVVADQLRVRATESVERLKDVRSPAVVQRPELLDGVTLRERPDGTVEWALPAWHLEGSLHGTL
jgi:hypothetical protein